ncbi:hypothetical protein Bpro_4961 (plasmid) [Polaromonas sp. JS666]|nr:hypothetical protein Bpro_4961 [Polaromonas sp. JS666]
MTLISETPTKTQKGTALVSVFASRHAETAAVVQLPGVPSFEGPNHVCVSGLVECSQLNCERHGADTAASLMQCVLRCKRTVDKSWWCLCCPWVQLFSQAQLQGFRVQWRVSGGAGFPITQALIILLIRFQDELWIYSQGQGFGRWLVGLGIAMLDLAHAHSSTCLCPLIWNH